MTRRFWFFFSHLGVRWICWFQHLVLHHVIFSAMHVTLISDLCVLHLQNLSVSLLHARLTTEWDFFSSCFVDSWVIFFSTCFVESRVISFQMFYEMWKRSKCVDLFWSCYSCVFQRLSVILKWQMDTRLIVLPTDRRVDRVAGHLAMHIGKVIKIVRVLSKRKSSVKTGRVLSKRKTWLWNQRSS